MCTVSWSYGASGGLALCFNRDEQHVRAAGLPVQIWAGGFLAPVDAEAGGTWLAVRQDGILLALLNHYPPGFAPFANGVSRGALIPVLAARIERPGLRALRDLVSARMNPFRLLLLAPDGERRVFTWDGSAFTGLRVIRESTGMLTSSSWNTAAVVAARHVAFRGWRKSHPSPALADLCGFHCQGQHPRGGAWAVCMSREDARSVSLNTLHIAEGRAVMTHQIRKRGADGFDADSHTMQIRVSNRK